MSWQKRSWTNRIHASRSCTSEAEVMHRKNPWGRVWTTSGQNVRESRTKWTDATKKVVNCGKGLDHAHKCILWSAQYIKFLKMTPSLWSLKYHSPQKGTRTPWRNSCFQIRGSTYKRWAYAILLFHKTGKLSKLNGIMSKEYGSQRQCEHKERTQLTKPMTLKTETNNKNTVSE